MGSGATDAGRSRAVWAACLRVGRRSLPVALLLAVLPLAAWAQTYPTRVVRIIVPGPPSGSTDFTARLVSQGLATLWKQQVIVDNRAGAGGMIGTEFVARSAPDGYTFMLGHNGTHAINTSLRQGVSYDPVRDFAAITLAATSPNILVAHPSLPVKSVKELVALARSRPGQLLYGSSGVGHPQHIAGEVFNTMAGVRMVHIPYKGSAAALLDLMGGNVQLQFPNLPVALPHVESGRLRGLAVTSRRRAGAAPQFPTIDEAGLPGYDVTTWYGFFAPAAVPGPILRQLHADLTGILADAEVRRTLVQRGSDVVASSSAEFEAFVKSERENWSRVIKASGATPD